MKIVIIHGQNHKGSTYNIAHAVSEAVAEKVSSEITEYFLPRDFGSFCVGCTNCILKGEENCPHHESLSPIVKSLLDSDLIILASPVYVYHATGAMKAFLDHLGYIWMAHRPETSMFKKQALCVSTAAGAGMKSAIKDMSDSLFYWGVPKIYRIGIAVSAMNWESVSPKKRKQIDSKVLTTARQITRRHGKVKPGLKTKAFFHLMRLLEKNGWNKLDKDYWRAQGWLAKQRPWK